MAVSTSVESRIEFQRDGTGKITSLTWQRDGAALRTARRVEIEKHEDVRFSSGDVTLTGTLISPASGGKHPAIVLVHGSGAENREYILPFARFLIRRGMAVLGYDKRGVGGSTGDWNTASFDDLAGDVVAAFEYLKTRSDIDPTQIGLLGISQAGWIMPLAAVRAKDVAFLISISGAGVPPAETTIDQARNEMTMTSMPPQGVDEIVALLKLQYEFARTGQGGTSTPLPVRSLPLGWVNRPTRSLERRTTLTGNSSSACTSTILDRLFVSSRRRHSRCGENWTTTSWRKRTRQPGRRHSKRQVIETTR